MTQVQLRLSKNTVDNLDVMISKGLFKNRSHAIRSILIKYEEIQKTRDFYKLLLSREKECDNINNLIDLENLD